MGKHIFAVSLNKDLVLDVKEVLKEYGGKLSPLLENLLIEWIKKHKIKEDKKL